MTHEELLKDIDDQEFSYDTLATALRAVVELHRTWDETKYGYDYCKACEKNGLGYRNYPCPTIQVIEKVLK